MSYKTTQNRFRAAREINAMEDPTPEQARALLRLRDAHEVEFAGVRWLRLGDEIKASPHGQSGDYDMGCLFYGREEIREIAERT